MFARSMTRNVLLSFTTSAAVAALVILPGIPRAAEHEKRHDMGKMPTSMSQLMKMDPEECMKMMDEQHKGHVTKKEFMQFQEQLWQRMDKNKDGRVDRAEFTDAG